MDHKQQSVTSVKSQNDYYNDNDAPTRPASYPPFILPTYTHLIVQKHRPAEDQFRVVGNGILSQHVAIVSGAFCSGAVKRERG